VLCLKRTVWRDGYWIVPDPSHAVRLRRLSFTERIRAIPTHVTAHSLQYASWWILLVLFLLARYLMFFYMATAVFSSTRGIPISMPPVAVTSAALESFASGAPIVDWIGAEIVEPDRDRIYIIDLAVDGSLQFDGQAITRDDLPDLLWKLHPPSAVVGVFVAIRTEQGVTYQQVVNVLERVWQNNLADPNYPVRLLLVSLE
jgi:biopolymer transport protein ExbD